jgi:glycosyltransferase involved in cell wall biosynthesis
VQPGQYVLYVSRLEPENNAHMVVEAYQSVQSAMPLLIVGDAPYARDYISKLKNCGDLRVRFPGAIYGEGYRQLQSHAYCYIHATEVGGTHPALVEAMGAGNCVIVYDTPETREVVGECGLFFTDTADLTRQIQRVIDNPEIVRALQNKAQARAKAVYSWDAVTEEYEKLFLQLT